LIITPTLRALEIAAERFALRKKCNDTPPFQPFNDDCKDKFIGIERGLDFFTPAEKIYLIKKELDALRADSGEKIVPGHQNAELYKGKSIIRRMLSHKIIACMQPVHDREHLGKLRGTWIRGSRLMRQPVDDLDSYFGVHLGLYFNFVETYGQSLVALLLCMIAVGATIGFSSTVASVLTIIWSFAFILEWRRRQTTRAYTKGILNRIGRSWEEARPEHFGPLSRNEITGKDEPHYDYSLYTLRRLVSFLVTLACCYCSYLVMQYYYLWEQWTYNEFGIDSYTAMIPGIIYTVIVIISSQQYRLLARRLTDFENHRTESLFQRYLLVKLLVFEFINNFLVLYLLAFIYQDIAMLRSTVVTTMTISQVFVEIFEGYVPFLLYKRRTKDKKKNFSNLIEQMQYEQFRDPYEGEFDEYLEIWIQFGYVCLFTSIYEYAPLCALVATIIEIRNDAHKFCNLFQRPESRISENIGFWDDAFSLMAFLSIPTQVGLAVMQNKTTWRNAILAEHLVIFVCVILIRWRPVSSHIQTNIDKDEYYQHHQLESNAVKKIELAKHD